jgi:hypothetical protein
MVYKILKGPPISKIIDSLLTGEPVNFTVEYNSKGDATEIKVVVSSASVIKVVVSSASVVGERTRNNWLLNLVVLETEISFFKYINNLPADYNSESEVGSLRL